MLIRLLLVCCVIILPINAKAGLVLGAYGGKAHDNGKGIDKLEGNVAGAKVGWRWRWLALEVASTKFDLETKPGQREEFFVQKAELKGSGTDLMLRFYPFSFISIVGGITTLNLDGKIELTNINGNAGSSASQEGSIYDNGSLFGVGLHLPIGKGFEIYGEYIRRKWRSMVPNFGEPIPDLALTEWHAGLTWTWESGGSPKSKDD